MIIYSHTLTPRLQYVVDFLSNYYHTPIKILCDEEKYVSSTDPHKINYSYHRIIEEEIWIHSHVLLFETAVRQVKVESFEINDYKAFFKAEGDFSFDIFAAIFYLVTRYEEYLPYQKDALGRYDHTNAVAFKENFLHLPLIDIWLHHFKQLLESAYPGLKLSLPTFNFKPTYDIDIAWSYKNKGVKRNTGAILQLFFTGKWRRMAHRISVLRGKTIDPYDAYDWMDNLHQHHHLEPIYFFLVALQNGKLDKNISVKDPFFQQLVQRIGIKYEVGLHPSWASGDQASLLPKEKGTLEAIIQKPVTASRQHFIRFDLPATYRRLITLGITDDYSMGYGNINGFRASTANSFYWYDLKNELATTLLIHPFCFMEATSFHELNFTPDEAFREIMQYFKVVKSFNGTLTTIWHNSFLGQDKMYGGWRDMYEKFVSSITSN